jgi:hypothetical protein
MRISKLYLVVCAAALGAGVVTVRADDNPAQAAARAALEDKMRALNAQPAPTNAPVSAPVKSKKPARPAVTTVPATPPPAQNPPAAAPAAPEQPAPIAVTPSGAAMRQPTNPPPAMTTLPATPPAVKPAQKPAPTTPSSKQGLFAPVPPASGSGPVGAPTQTTQPSTNVQTPAPPVATPQPVSTKPPPNPNSPDSGKVLGLKPIVAPPLPITSAQQAELQALLEKYEANAITPEQYQAERAKILAGHQ